MFDWIIPADDFPAVSEAGLFEHLAGLDADPEGASLVGRAQELVDALDTEARRRHGAGVDALPVDVGEPA